MKGRLQPGWAALDEAGAEMGAGGGARGPHHGEIRPLVHLGEACHAASEESRELGGSPAGWWAVGASPKAERAVNCAIFFSGKMEADFPRRKETAGLEGGKR